ncbi:MAG TPA: ATP-binding protein [Solirubrobacteraceae bacterium]
MTLAARAPQAPDAALGAQARRTAHQLGEVCALLSAGLHLGGADGERSLRLAEQRLRRYVADLHDLDILVDPARFERLRLSGLVADAAAAVALLPAGERLGAVADDGMPAIAGDRDALLALLTHLLRFSASAARPGGVRVQVGARRLGDRVHVTLTDDRTELSAAAAERLFAPFAPPAGRGPLVGAGVGPVVAQRIVAGHGGAIAAAARTPAGVALTFDLPAAR